MDMDKLAGMETLSESLKEVVGTPITKDSLQSIKSISERNLQGMVDAGTMNSFNVDKVQTKHQSKKLLGRVSDFFLWKTFLRRWYYKPFYVQVNLEDRLRVLWEHTSVFEGISEEDFEKFACSVSEVNVWEEQYPKDPYSIVLMNYSFRPVLPLEYVSFNVTLPGEDNEDDGEV